MHDRFWADDLIYTASAGRRIGKAQIMHEVREEAAAPSSPTDETATYSAEDIRIQQYGTTAIVAFRLVGTTKKGEKTEIANYLNSGTFLKRDGKWQARQLAGDQDAGGKRVEVRAVPQFQRSVTVESVTVCGDWTSGSSSLLRDELPRGYV